VSISPSTGFRFKGPTRLEDRRQAKVASSGSRTKLIQEKNVDTTFLITHRSNDLAEGPDLYQTFKAKKDGCVRVVLHPG
jgi:threonine dehydrogenase-like Zn-dependent dehydrogenase